MHALSQRPGPGAALRRAHKQAPGPNTPTRGQGVAQHAALPFTHQMDTRREALLTLRGDDNRGTRAGPGSRVCPSPLSARFLLSRARGGVRERRAPRPRSDGPDPAQLSHSRNMCRAPSPPILESAGVSVFTQAHIPGYTADCT